MFINSLDKFVCATEGIQTAIANAKTHRIFSYVNIKRPTCVVGQVYTKITIKPSLLDKRKISTHDSISAAIV